MDMGLNFVTVDTGRPLPVAVAAITCARASLGKEETKARRLWLARRER